MWAFDFRTKHLPKETKLEFRPWKDQEYTNPKFVHKHRDVCTTGIGIEEFITKFYSGKFDFRFKNHVTFIVKLKL